MYKTIIMPVDVFEMELSDKAVRHAEFLAQDDGVIHRVDKLLRHLPSRIFPVKQQSALAGYWCY